MPTQKDRCTWAVPDFPRSTKDRYIAYCRANGAFVRDHLEYLILKTLRDAGVDIPKFSLEDLMRRMIEKSKERNG